MKTDTEVNMEPLPGYRLIERLGTGGYGEVWRAEAPGGLTKAIKFVFGKHDEKRASHEMRALERIRSVRHPFLLSLERIEIVDGRLIVVMELADGSIKDRFEECRAQGLPGIPRDEMVSYLRDAADALDFMAHAHALQHLDIKPENLLLLAGHVKVADFGLVKDVRQSQASLVGGMTPLYAAPEVFRGTPTSHSDQYSLGILFQEMLTGTLPFGGSSAAELTLQHLNDEPDMTALSPADRYAVSRALAKEAQHRYPTCREFVDILSKAAMAAGEVASVSAPSVPFVGSSQFSDSLPRENSQTDLFDDATTAWNSEPEHRLIELPPPDASLVDLPAIDVSAHDARAVPTLVIGVGGAAGRVLSHLRQQICERHGEAASLPSFPMVLVDTDAKALADACRRDRCLSPDETLHVPLRRPQHYRDHSQQLLQWLSRRWLYNIPRSLRTEGLRPLGRLALADHARQLGQRIRRAVVQSVDAGSVTRSSETLQRIVRSDSVRVLVVASISGGSGSGMSLDLGYMVRAVLHKLAVSNSHIMGIMMHSTGGDPRMCELARVNSYSWLTEFHHFQQPENGYPGDASCGLPSHEAGIGPFDDTYLVHLGEQLDAFEFDQATQGVADYLRMNMMSPAQAFFDACRHESKETLVTSAADLAKVRSFGICRRAATENKFCDHLSDELVKQVVRRWRADDLPATSAQESSSARKFSIAESAEQFVQQHQATANGIATNSRTLVEAQLGTTAEEFLKSRLGKQGGSRVGASAELQAIDQIFDGDDAGRAESSPAASEFLGQTLSDIVRPLEENLRREIRRWVMSRIDDPQQRIAGAQRAAQWMGGHFQKVAAELQQFARVVGGKMNAVRTSAGDGGEAATVGSSVQAPRGRHAAQYFRLRLDQLALSAASLTVRAILSDTKSFDDEIVALRQEVDRLLATGCRAVAAEEGTPEAIAAETLTNSMTNAAACMEARFAQLAEQVDQQLQADFLSQQGGLMPTIMRGGRQRAQLNAKLREFAGQAVGRALAGVNVMKEVLSEGDEVRPELRSALATATPSLMQFGGTRRVLTVLPRDAADPECADKLSRALGTPTTVITGDDDSLTLCVEAGQLSVPYAAVEFVQHRRDRVDFAGRIHSRTDILWTPLVSASALAAPCPWGEDSLPARQMTQDLTKTMVI